VVDDCGAGVMADLAPRPWAPLPASAGALWGWSRMRCPVASCRRIRVQNTASTAPPRCASAH